MKINVSIFGVSGYTGGELLRIAHNHNFINIVSVFGNNSKGSKLIEIYPELIKLKDLVVSDIDDYKSENVDLVFLCLPHKISRNLIHIFKDEKIIDLSADFRFDNHSLYKEWYEDDHPNPLKLDQFVYGISELNRKKISTSKFVSNPGCYPTSVLIPILPFFKEEIISENTNIVIDSKSGISGSGKNLSENNLFAEVSENFQPYKIEKHRHMGEINQEISRFFKSTKITFIPHLLPISRGILSTIYIDLKNMKKKFEDLKFFLQSYYENDFFVEIYMDKRIPCIKSVRGTNNIAINLFQDYNKEKLIIISCIDNLIKGAAGQAIQNMNIMFDLDEKEGLMLSNLKP